MMEAFIMLIACMFIAIPILGVIFIGAIVYSVISDPMRSYNRSKISREVSSKQLTEHGISIKAFGNGGFQVWKRGEVLRPATLSWEGHYQSHHELMFFDTAKQAARAALNVINKERVVSDNILGGGDV